MTDKPIIKLKPMGDVDVSGCENALQGKHTILCAGSEDRALCDANKNCLYKKYKRKEQECEEFKQTLAEIKEIAEVEIECKTYEIENDCFNETRCKALNEHIDFTKQILQKISECEVENAR